MTVNCSKLYTIVLSFSLLVLATPCSAEVILSNSVDPPYQGSGSAFANTTTIKAVGVEIPAAGPDYRFDSFRVVLQGVGPDSLAAGRIYSNDGTPTPQAELQALSTPIVSFGHDVYDIVSPVPFTLEAGEKYWFAITGGMSGVAFRWDRTGDRTDPDVEPRRLANYLG